MSFGAVAADYDRLRPGPPEAAVRWLVPAGCQTAVDLGAGTGLLSRALGVLVPQVIAVEPDARMRAVLRERSPGVQAVDGSGESIPLPDASADGVFVSSAWHWMDPARAVPEVARVLRDGGRLGVMWTSRDREVGWVHQLEPRRRDADGERAGGERDGARQEWPQRRELTLPAGGLFGAVETASFRFSLTMTVDRLADLLGTYSGVITASPDDRAAALDWARATLRERFPGRDEIDVPMRSWCWRADRTGRAA
jgi:SAM-dependent methyltransferase